MAQAVIVTFHPGVSTDQLIAFIRNLRENNDIVEDAVAHAYNPELGEPVIYQP